VNDDVIAWRASLAAGALERGIQAAERVERGAPRGRAVDRRSSVMRAASEVGRAHSHSHTRNLKQGVGVGEGMIALAALT